MTLCHECKKENNGKAKFCTQCGSALNREPPFSERMGKAGKRFERRMDHATVKFDEWYNQKFGLAGPIVGSFIGLIILRIVIFLMLRAEGDLAFFASIGEFLYDYLLLIFGLMLLSNYNTYCYKRYKASYQWISPAVSSISFIFSVWIFAHIFLILGEELPNSFLTRFGSFLHDYLLVIFFIVLLLAYGFLLAKGSYFKK